RICEIRGTGLKLCCVMNFGRSPGFDSLGARLGGSRNGLSYAAAGFRCFCFSTSSQFSRSAESNFGRPLIINSGTGKSPHFRI
ncbi:hypothetical protein, partial [Thiolapillus sp.]|uniref:hypothetical protein n=1 Tax=Thiolapillus sp. TaxID=2017437 RepID=UPI0025EA592F